MGDINRALGGGTTFEFEGTTYTLSPWSFEIQAEFEKYLEREAYMALKRLKSVMSSEEYIDSLNKLQQDIAVGLYSFGSKLVADSFRSPKHFKRLLYLMLLPNHPTVTPEMTSKMVEKDYEEMMIKMAEANSDPTSSEKELLTS